MIFYASRKNDANGIIEVVLVRYSNQRVSKFIPLVIRGIIPLPGIGAKTLTRAVRDLVYKVTAPVWRPRVYAFDSGPGQYVLGLTRKAIPDFDPWKFNPEDYTHQLLVGGEPPKEEKEAA